MFVTVLCLAGASGFSSRFPDALRRRRGACLQLNTVSVLSFQLNPRASLAGDPLKGENSSYRKSQPRLLKFICLLVCLLGWFFSFLQFVKKLLISSFYTRGRGQGLGVRRGRVGGLGTMVVHIHVFVPQNPLWIISTLRSKHVYFDKTL